MVNSPFREATADIRGTSWLAEAARSSLRAADSKFYGTPSGPLLRVEMRGHRRIGVHDTAVVAMAIQDATAKIGRIIRNPHQESTQARKKDRELAILIPRGQSGSTLFFGFPVSKDEHSESLLPGRDGPSLSETAMRELLEILPGSSDDDAAVDAVLGQRITVRNAVSDIVEAVDETATELHLEFTSVGDERLSSQLSTAHASVLRDGLREIRTDRREEVLTGRLDGVRTRRRIFYLELETGEEVHGAIGPEPELMAEIRRYLDRRIIATIESQRVETIAGRRSRPTYRLLRLDAAPSLFDDES